MFRVCLFNLISHPVHERITTRGLKGFGLTLMPLPVVLTQNRLSHYPSKMKNRQFPTTYSRSKTHMWSLMPHKVLFCAMDPTMKAVLDYIGDPAQTWNGRWNSLCLFPVQITAVLIPQLAGCAGGISAGDLCIPARTGVGNGRRDR